MEDILPGVTARMEQLLVVIEVALKCVLCVSSVIQIVDLLSFFVASPDTKSEYHNMEGKTRLGLGKLNGGKGLSWGWAVTISLD